jgi:hypothetical protein
VLGRLVFGFVLALALGWARPAVAQSSTTAATSTGTTSSSATLSVAPHRPSVAEYDRELAAIHESATVATVLYVTGVLVHLGGLGAFAGGLAGSASLYGPSSHSDVAVPFLIAGIPLAILGIVLIAIGGGRDGESGRRRNQLGPRPAVSWGGAPTLDGAALWWVASF